MSAQTHDTIAEYVRWLRALGMQVRDLDPMDVYMAAGPIVRNHSCQNKPVLPWIASLSAAERAELRDQCIAAIPPKVKRTSRASGQ
jgi:hypothetical protein